MRKCQYQNNGVTCKNWISVPDESVLLCPLHAGVLDRSNGPTSVVEQKKNDRMMFLEAQCDHMSNEELENHIEQLAQLREDLKLREQAAVSSKNKRVKALISKGASLTDAQKAELESLRNGPRVVKAPKAAAPKLSTEEKAIQALIEKFGFTREQIIAMQQAKKAN